MIRIQQERGTGVLRSRVLGWQGTKGNGQGMQPLLSKQKHTHSSQIVRLILGLESSHMATYEDYPPSLSVIHAGRRNRLNCPRL